MGPELYEPGGTEQLPGNPLQDAVIPAFKAGRKEDPRPGPDFIPLLTNVQTHGWRANTGISWFPAYPSF